MKQIDVSNYRFICFTDMGRELMEKVAKELSKKPLAAVECESLSVWTERNFKKGNILVFVGACGIAVRAIAPFIKDKTVDPAVIVMDERGDFVIPLLSGHLGGAVKAAKNLADITGAVNVVTTATDVRGEFAIDVFASENNLAISDMKKAREFTALLLQDKKASFRIDPRFKDDIKAVNVPENLTGNAGAFFEITPGIASGLHLIPKCIVVGIGCRRGKSGGEITEFFERRLLENGLEKTAVKAIVSADIKKDEEGITDLAKELDIPFITYDSQFLMSIEGDFSSSDFVKEKTGTDNVCERSVMAYGCRRLIVKKIAEDGMTFAAGVLEVTLDMKGKL